MSTGEHGIPQQRVGGQLDAQETVTLSSSEEAQKIFALAVERLLNVNHWDKLAGPMSAIFKLTDGNGRVIHGPAQPGLHFKIDVPGPGPTAGEGFDWVKVEALDDERNPSGNEESVTLRVRPSPDPETNHPEIAHFFNDNATSSFRIERKGTEVTASVHGRNEVPNVDASATQDKIRNSLVGTGATAGLAKPQWNGLVKGLLKQD